MRNNNLEDYRALSFKNIEKIDYFVERDLQYKKTKEEEMNGSKLESSTENEFWESQNELETVDWDEVTNSTELPESSMNLEVLSKIHPFLELLLQWHSTYCLMNIQLK